MESAETKTYTRVLSKKNFLTAISESSKTLVENFNVNAYGPDSIPVGIYDFFHFINFISSEDEWNELTRKLFLQCFLKSEQKTKGSGFLSVYLLANRLAGKDIIGLEKLKSFSASCQQCTADEAFCSLKYFIDDNIFDIIKSIVKKTGTDGNITINSTKASIPTLELYSGHKFNIGLHDMFADESIKINEAKVVVYDGALQDISQIDRLFTESSESKQPIVIFARSFANDIISTINSNYQRKTLFAFPIEIKDKIENINLINDISLCTGSRIIDSGSGLRLSNIGLSDLNGITGVQINKRNILFESKPEYVNSINKRIDEINEKIQYALWETEMSRDDVDMIYSGRIESLSTNTVKFWVPGDELSLLYARKCFSFSIDYISAFANSGKIKTRDVLELESSLPTFMPSNIVNTGVALSEKMYSSILSVGAGILLE